MEKKGKSRSYNLLHFHVVGNNKHKPKTKKSDLYVAVYSIISLVYPSTKSSKAQIISDKLADNPENLENFYRRTQKLRREYSEGSKTTEDIIKLVRYILREDYDIT